MAEAMSALTPKLHSPFCWCHRWCPCAIPLNLVQQIGEIIVPFYDTSIKRGTLILDTLRKHFKIGGSLGSLSVDQSGHFN